MRPRLLKIGHVAGMQDVEAAVGEDDLLVVRTGIVDCQQQLFETQHAAFGTFFTLDGATQLRRADGRRTEFADHDARRQVGQAHRMRQFLASSNCCRQG
ncbi:hypothetical protein D3C73_742430 [compost metagenome]